MFSRTAKYRRFIGGNKRARAAASDTSDKMSDISSLNTTAQGAVGLKPLDDDGLNKLKDVLTKLKIEPLSEPTTTRRFKGFRSEIKI